MPDFSKIISKRLGITEGQISNTIALLEQGATIPFISRYRKEVTGSLDEEQITAIRDELSKLKELEKLSTWPAAEGLRIVAVAPGEWPARVLNAAAAKWGLKGPEIFRDPGNALFKAYRVKKVPYTVYLGADGNRKDVFLGAATAAELEAFLLEQRN